MKKGKNNKFSDENYLTLSLKSPVITKSNLSTSKDLNELKNCNNIEYYDNVKQTVMMKDNEILLIVF